eukprot:COSAG04_NODE_743_length_10649_cov_26.557820_1_plen_259_part_00
MVHHGMKDEFGEPVAPPVGPLRWAADLSGSSLAIDGPKPPPADYAELKDSAEFKQRREEFQREQHKQASKLQAEKHRQAAASEAPYLAFTHRGLEVELSEDCAYHARFLPPIALASAPATAPAAVWRSFCRDFSTRLLLFSRPRTGILDGFQTAFESEKDLIFRSLFRRLLGAGAISAGSAKCLLKTKVFPRLFAHASRTAARPSRLSITLFPSYLPVFTRFQRQFPRRRGGSVGRKAARNGEGTAPQRRLSQGGGRG